MTLGQIMQHNVRQARALVPAGIETLSEYQQLLWKETSVRTALFIAQETVERQPGVIKHDDWLEASRILGELNEEFDTAHAMVEAYCEFYPEHVGEDLEQPQALSA
jgi:hypothetical protein